MSSLRTPIRDRSDAPSSGRIDAAGMSFAAACLATALTHLVLVRRALGPDEGGFLVVARHWRDAGPHLYGPLWVDRPPGLIAVFAVANQLGPWGTRILLTVIAVAVVAMVGRAATLVADRTAGAWAAWTAYALGSSVLLQAGQLNGEYAAILCVTASMLFVLLALRRTIGSAMPFTFGFAAGGTAALAVLMKQNFLDGFVFAGLLLGATALGDRERRRQLAVIGAAGAAGALAVVAVTLVWATHHGGPSALFEAMYGFRAQATELLSKTPMKAQHARAAVLLVIAVGSGLLVLAAQLLIQNRRKLLAWSPLAWALAGTAAFDLLGLILGANFWPHYLLAFVPVLSLGAGLAAARSRQGASTTRTIIAAMALLTAVASPTAALAVPPGKAWTVGHWVHQSAYPGDTIVVTYSHPNVVAASGLRPGYPYLWSLPVRTLDPHLTTLTQGLDRPAHAPTWVVIWDHPDAWSLNKAGQLQQSLHAHYRLVARVCRHPVWLREDVSRTLAPMPTECGGGAL